MIEGRYKVVARFQDGSQRKGFVDDFWPNARAIRFKEFKGKEEDLVLDKLKALFYVRRFDGNRARREVKKYGSKEAMPEGVAVRIKFKDNEMVEGLAANTNLSSMGFFLTPADPSSNNIRIFVIKSSLEEYEVIGLKNSL